MKSKLLFIFAVIPVLMFYLTLGFAAGAAGVDITPIKVTFSPAESGKTLQLTNNNDDLFAAKISVKKWLHDNNTDQYLDTKDLIITPLTCSILPGQKQILVVGLLNQQRGPEEQAYRIFIDELPGPLTPTTNTSVSINFQFLIPIYVAPLGAEIHKITWNIVKKSNNSLLVTIANNGNVHLSISSMQIQNTAKQTVANTKSGILIFPNHTYTFPMKLIAPLTTKQIMINADTSWGTISTPNAIA
jgi:fimbrial chaperone protein